MSRRTQLLNILAVLATTAGCRDPAGAGGEPGEPQYLAPNIATPQNVVEEMLRLGGVGKDDVVYDLGCGDGRIVVTAARLFGARSVGVDIDQKQLARAEANVKTAGVENLVSLRTEDLLATDFSEATVVTLYLSLKVNERLRPRLEAQLKPGTRVLSHDFDIPGWYFDKRVTLRDEYDIQRDLYLFVMGRQHKPPAGSIYDLGQTKQK